MIRVVDALNTSLHRIMEANDRVVLLGEDILDPYGGAFKVVRGLSTKYPGRIITTPISEASIIGMGIGLALDGYRPVVEIMFGDFITLGADQLINHAAKMTWMYGDSMPLPLIVRTPMGGRRGYGPTHSQCLERLFLGIPGLDVVALSTLYDPGVLLEQAVLHTDKPVLFVENKTAYASPILTDEELASDGWQKTLGSGSYPAVSLTHGSTPSDVTLLTYGGMAPFVLKAARRLRDEEGLHCGIVVMHQLSPLNLQEAKRDLEVSRRLVVVEEGWTSWGWAAEVLSQLTCLRLDAPPQRVGAKPCHIPASKEMEDEVLPSVEDVFRAAIATVDSTYR